jgi:hypothetical protein
LLYNQIELQKIHKTFACTPSDIFSTFWLSFIREKIGCLGFGGSVFLPYKEQWWWGCYYETNICCWFFISCLFVHFWDWVIDI